MTRCWLYSEPLRAWLDSDLEWSPRSLEASLDVRNANLRSLMLRVAEEARDPGFGVPMLVELIAGQMAIELARYCTAFAEGPVADGLAPWRLRPSKFASAFRRATGEAPRAYRQRAFAKRSGARRR